MEIEECERLIHQFLEIRENRNAMQEMINRKEKRLIIDLNKLRTFNNKLTQELIKKPSSIQSIFEDHLNTILDQDEVNQKQKQKKKTNTKQDRFRISFTGIFGKNMVSPRGLNSSLANQLVCIQGIVTRTSIVRPKLIKSFHYCEETNSGTVKEYHDQYNNQTNIVDNTGKVINKANNISGFGNNSVPMKDINGNPLSFEYGLSEFRDFQVILVQEPPETTPLGQLPRSIEVVLQDDLVDKVKPGDRMEIIGIFKCVASSSTTFSGNFKTVLIASSLRSLSTEVNVPKIGPDDIPEIKKIADRSDLMDLLSRSLAPSIFGSENIKKALVLQLLGGVEKNLENGTHLRGDINIMLIGDPSTAKSQFLRHILAMAPNAIATTGRGSTGVGLTAAVVVDKDTGERHLEAGAMVLGDRGVVCIDEFDKMNELDRVAIHEVMEQQTVTIAKAGIHVSLNARCSVLSAANPIYGEYQKDLPASKNIGLPDSLLSRFDLVFICLDEDDAELDRNIADRVIRNHQFPSETTSLFTGYDERIIEPDINLNNLMDNQVYEKYNPLLHGNKKSQILTKNFLKKYIFYAKKSTEPDLTDEAKDYITNAWTQLRIEFDKEKKDDFNYQAVPITVRTLETLIRLSTSHAKARLSKNVQTKDCEFAENLLRYTLLGEEDKKKIKTIIDTDEEEEKSIKIEKKEVHQDKKKYSSKKSASKISKSESKFPNNNSHEDNYDLSDEAVNYVFKKFLNYKKNEDVDEISITRLWEELNKSNEFKLVNKTHLIHIIKKLDSANSLYYDAERNMAVFI